LRIIREREIERVVMKGEDFYVNISARKEESWEKQSEYKEVA